MRLFQSTVITFVSNVVRLFIGMAAGVFIARALGPVGRGEYNLALLVGTFLVFMMDLGFSSAVSYFVSSGKFSSDQMLKNSFWASWILGVAGLLLFLLMEHVGMAEVLLGKFAMTPSVMTVLIFLPAAFFQLYFNVLLLGEGRMLVYNLVPIVAQFAVVTTIGIQYFRSSLTVNWVVFLYLMGNVVSIFVMLLFRRNFFSALMTPFFTWKEIKTILKFSVPAHLGAVIQFLNFRLDSFIVNFYLGVGAVGIYTLSGSFAELLWMISRPIGTILMPKVAASGSATTLGDVVFRSSSLAFFATLVVSIALAVVAPWAIPLVYGAKFQGSVTPLLLLLPGATIFCYTNVQACYLTGIGKPQINTAVSGISLIATVGLDLWLIPRIGVNGAAIASTVSYTLSSVLTVYQASKLSKVPLYAAFRLPRKEEFRLVLDGLSFLTGLVRR
ncbi:MAG: flippase [Acidobacteriia bacterium]|nr:flippase [Terriglobia bacterium]